MRGQRIFLNTLVGVVIGAAACSPDQTSPVEPQGASGPALSLVGNVTGLVQGLLLNCSPLPASNTTKEIGPKGGEVWVGPHYLVIPKGALNRKVTIRGEIPAGNHNSVRFYPEGLTFGTGAKIILSYRNCSGLGMLLPKSIVYTDDGLLSILEILTTTENRGAKTVTAPLKHFSRYAVAY